MLHLDRLSARSALAALTLTTITGYLIWRLGTVNSGSVTSVLFYLLELHAGVSFAAFTFAAWRPPASAVPAPVTTTDLRLAVVIPTYNEPEDILLPTMAAAVAIQPAHETWVLDDGKRDWVRRMAHELGARYMARPTNEHAKAGNINHALGWIDADVIGVLDADHVPMPGFLTNMLGYFDDPEVKLVQSPQDFYNEDSFEHMEATDGSLWSEESLFYRSIQPAKNRWNSAFWCGTSALVRTDALRAIGGVATSSVTEDMLTTLNLHRRGAKTVFHNEVLARGLAPSGYQDYILQRRRWAAGSVQVFRSGFNPLIVEGLSFPQRLSYFSSILGWFDGLRTLGFLLVSLLVIATGQSPVAAPWQVFLPVQIAVVSLSLLSLRALGRGTFRLWPSMIFEYLRLPASLDVAYQLLFGYRSGFKVTPKGKAGDDRRRSPVPGGLIAVLGVATGSILYYGYLLAQPYDLAGYVHVAAFALLLQLLVALRAVARIQSDAFASDRRAARRFDQPALVSFVDTATDKATVAEMTQISAVGAFVPARWEMEDRDPTLALLRGDEISVLTAWGPTRLAISPERAGRRGVSVQFLEGQWRQRAALMLTMFGVYPRPATTAVSSRPARPRPLLAPRPELYSSSGMGVCR